MRIDFDPYGTSDTCGITSAMFPITAGHPYRFGSWSKSSPDIRVGVELNCYDATGVMLETTRIFLASTGSQAWTPRYGSASCGASSTQASLGLLTWNPGRAFSAEVRGATFDLASVERA